MTTEQWQEVYDNFYYYKHQIDKLCDDYYLPSDKIKAKGFMDEAYNKIKYNSVLLELFNKKGNINDLKDISQFSYAVSIFLNEIKTFNL
ncbi:hypothetical protein [Flavobacterium sp. C4GT6]|uniref:hypothetical protein n=1 Tax=Flavobacterium sp. C4GT6 TaxID=3103818 RepID=UPI002ED69614